MSAEVREMIPRKSGASDPIPDVGAVSLFINRELSWLDFNARVLAEAMDVRVPLLERLKFLAIFSTNLDEFYMVRVAGLRRQRAAGVVARTPDGLTPGEQLEAITRKVRELLSLRQECLAELLARLAEHDVKLVAMTGLDQAECATIDSFFESRVFPVLTPLAVDPGHPFPYISNLSISLAVQVRDPHTQRTHFARVKVPKSIPRWIPTGVGNRYVPLEEVIGANVSTLFPGLEVVGWSAFRVTRYSDLDLANIEEPEDLLATIEEQVFRRRFGEVVRVEVQASMPPDVRALLLEELAVSSEEGAAPLTQQDVQESGPLLDLGDLMTIALLEIPALRDPPFTPLVPAELQDEERSIFDIIAEHDILVHHPFDSFTATVERFLEAAATDPDVLAIKLTLYRTSGDTAIVRALTEAAQRGKQVAVNVELKARFDESNNITWARTLEGFGVHVSYGLTHVKTHTKTALVVRREPDGLRRYVHMGSGNYNSRTARLYTDVGLLTCNKAIGADVSDLFNSLTGISRQRKFRQLLVAPANMRERFLALIAREAEHARAGKPARIIAKINALVDPEMIQALYAASQAGVTVELIVRGICCLRPGVPGMSENIKVLSLVGRFLEHSRLFMFQNDADNEFFVGSADWMPRNLDRRVEAVAPILDKSLHPRVRALLQTCLEDNRQVWDLGSDGTWTRRQPDGEERATHRRLISNSWGLPGAGSTVREHARSNGRKAKPKRRR